MQRSLPSLIFVDANNGYSLLMRYIFKLTLTTCLQKHTIDDRKNVRLQTLSQWNTFRYKDRLILDYSYLSANPNIWSDPLLEPGFFLLCCEPVCTVKWPLFWTFLENQCLGILTCQPKERHWLKHRSFRPIPVLYFTQGISGTSAAVTSSSSSRNNHVQCAQPEIQAVPENKMEAKVVFMPGHSDNEAGLRCDAVQQLKQAGIDVVNKFYSIDEMADQWKRYPHRLHVYIPASHERDHFCTQRILWALDCGVLTVAIRSTDEEAEEELYKDCFLACDNVSTLVKTCSMLLDIPFSSLDDIRKKCVEKYCEKTTSWNVEQEWKRNCMGTLFPLNSMLLPTKQERFKLGKTTWGNEVLHASTISTPPFVICNAYAQEPTVSTVVEYAGSDSFSAAPALLFGLDRSQKMQTTNNKQLYLIGPSYSNTWVSNLCCKCENTITLEHYAELPELDSKNIFRGRVDMVLFINIQRYCNSSTDLHRLLGYWQQRGSQYFLLYPCEPKFLDRVLSKKDSSCCYIIHQQWRDSSSGNLVVLRSKPNSYTQNQKQVVIKPTTSAFQIKYL